MEHTAVASPQLESHVSVRVVTPALAAGVRALRVAPEQYPFVGDVQVALVHAQACPASDAMAILADDEVVGFYRIDMHPQFEAETYAHCAMLRSMAVDRRCQGRGIGTRALRACCDDLAARHPELQRLALTVNCGNAAAIHAYRKAGFVDTGRLHFGGRAGPQHLMLHELHARDAAVETH